MRVLTIIFLLFINTDSFAQGNPLTNKKFVLLVNPHNGQGEWLDFINDTFCIRSIGSVAWGTNSDTLNYKIKKDILLFRDFQVNKRSLTTKKLKIEQVSLDIFKRDNFMYTGRRLYFFQRDNDSLKSVIVLKRMK